MIVGTLASSRTVASVTIPAGSTNYTDGIYNYIKCTATGVIQVFHNKINFDAFLVGGGGSGDFNGGGGGQVRTTTGNSSGLPYLATSSNISVTVGAGGAPYTSGTETTFFSAVSAAGASPGLDTGVSGTGRVAGGSVDSWTRSFYFDEFGNVIYYDINTGYAGGGGGGSSSNGSTGFGSPFGGFDNYLVGGNGGAGDANPYATETSSLSRMGGGGAGNTHYANSPNPSITPGTVVDGASRTNASANSGGGSGGSLFGGYSGGSGIVILRYLKSEVSK